MASTHLRCSSLCSSKPVIRSSSSSPMLLLQGNSRLHFHSSFSIKCAIEGEALQPSKLDTSDDSFPAPDTSTLNDPETFPIERRKRSQIIRDRRSRANLEKAKPPNYEIGWKRTKVINLEKPIGYVLMDFLDKLVGLMEGEYGSTELLAKAGEIVAERVREEAEVLMDDGKVDERMVTELFRVLRLMEMDLSMVKASVKEETLKERLEQAKARCRQAILVAKAF